MTTGMTRMAKRAVGACLLVFCLGALTTLHGRELSRYDETVTLANEGSATIRLSLAVADWTEPRILIPVRHASLLNLQAPGFAPTAVRVLESKGNHFLALDIAGSGISPAVIEISFQVENYFAGNPASAPFGNRELSYTFVNVTFERIGKFSLKLILPAGYVFNDISDFSPQPKKPGAAVPYAISRAGGRNIASMAVDDVNLGDEIVLRCTFKSTKKSLPLLLTLIALAVAYLIFFRDMVKNGKNGTGTRP